MLNLQQAFEYFAEGLWTKAKDTFLTKNDVVNNGSTPMDSEWELVDTVTANNTITLPSLDTFAEIYIHMYLTDGVIVHQQVIKKESLLFESSNTTYREIILNSTLDAQTYVTYNISSNSITPNYIEGNVINSSNENVYTSIYVKKYVASTISDLQSQIIELTNMVNELKNNSTES